ncbi:hypothetical protein FACS189456_6350 [Bacteroidia bacterium]|nr:hypothetical protein FACS189456_6350 [Bacteroidia bacterium]
MNELLQNGCTLPVSNTLAYFMQNHIYAKDLNAQALQRFAQLTDATVDNAVAECMQSNDDVLRLLCLSLTGRYLPAIEISDVPFAPQRVQEAVTVAAAHFSLDETNAHYLVTSGTLSNKAYSLSGDGIKILTRKGAVCDIGEASDMLDATAFLYDSKKYFLCCHTHSK